MNDDPRDFKAVDLERYSEHSKFFRFGVLFSTSSRGNGVFNSQNEWRAHLIKKWAKDNIEDHRNYDIGYDRVHFVEEDDAMLCLLAFS